MSARVEACVLAAGRGRRMGFAKHLYALDGVPLLERVVRALLGTAATPIRVVLRPGDSTGAALAKSLGATPLFAESADEGRAASIRTAVRATRSDVSGLLVALADQPFLEARDFDSLLAEFTRAAQGIVRARYAGEPGTPVIFSRAHFPELLRLEGGDGGRRVIAANEDEVRFIEIDPARGRDLDTPEDLPVRKT